jgi:bacillithiol synthase
LSQDSAGERGSSGLRTMSVPFSEIPGQSRLFVDYQQNPLALSNFYPSAVDSWSRLPDRIPEVLANYTTERGVLCDALDEINRTYGAGDKTFGNIDRLRQADCVAIVTGQQAGLFTGPLYTIYKALSVVSLVNSLRDRGANVVPVFWTASEDHDFEEVSNAFFLDEKGQLAETRARPADLVEGTQVGFTRLDSSIDTTIDHLIGALPETGFTGRLSALLKETWTEGISYSDAFSKLLAKILDKFGIVIFDPVDSTLKKLAAPMYSRAIEKSTEIVSALVGRDKELAEAGYHSQVLVNTDYFPMFLHGDDHSRHSLKKTASGTYQAKGDKREFSSGDLARMAGDDPARFSPTVVLRPVVQDYLLPTLCYFGGGAEIAYFAQNSVVYRVMERPVTPILHRQSFTVVEAKHGRVLEKYGLNFTDLLRGKDKTITDVVEKFINPELAETFVDVGEKIDAEIDRLDRALAQLDPTLAQNLTTRRRKIMYHLSALRKKSNFAKSEKNEIVQRQMEALFTALLPHAHLQERTLNIATFLNSHGQYFIDWIYDSIDLDDKGHRIIFL